MPNLEDKRVSGNIVRGKRGDCFRGWVDNFFPIIVFGNSWTAFSSIQSVRLRVRTGRTAVPERLTGRDRHLGVPLDDCPGRAGGDCRCLGWQNLQCNSG